MQTFNTSSITSALAEVANNANTVISDVAPIAIGIAGVFLVWKLGMSFFKSMSKG